VCVIGAGYCGLSTALHLARHGRDVVLLEADAVGHGASGRNGGQVLPGFSAGLDDLLQIAGPDGARRLWDRSVEAMELVQALVATHEIGCDLRPGMLVAAVAERHAEALRRSAALLAERFGYTMAVLDATATRRIANAPSYVGGLLDRRAASLHPLSYARGLARAAMAAGVRLHEASRVERLASGEAITARGAVRADHIVLATNAAVGDLKRSRRGHALPLTAYMGATARLTDAQARAVLPGGIAVYDSETMIQYYRLSDDRRLVIGAGGGLPKSDAAVARHIARRVARAFPVLADLPVEFGWSGVVDISRNRLLDLGRDDGLWHAQGFSGHGVALATLSGKLIADAIGGDDAGFRQFADIPHRPWRGGPTLGAAAFAAHLAWRVVRRNLVGRDFHGL